MRNIVEIENIEEMRRQEGIDDVELRLEIRNLRVGAIVKLTFLTSSKCRETLLVRITSIRGPAFRGKLVDQPTTMSKHEARAVFAFTSAHIHSTQKKESAACLDNDLPLESTWLRSASFLTSEATMAKKKKKSTRMVPPTVAKSPKAVFTEPLALTLEEHIHCIKALSQRMDGYIRFVCQLGNEPGASDEVKKRALAVFYRQMIIAERQLGLIYNELRLE